MNGRTQILGNNFGTTQIKSILDKFKSYNLPLNVEITGGEPLLLDGKYMGNF